MSVVYITEQGARVKKSGGRLIVTKKGKVVEEIPLMKVDQVRILGQGVTLTTPALAALAARNVDVVYLTQRGRFLARVNGKESKHGNLRFKQARLVDQPQRCFELAKQIVAGKLINQRALLNELASSAPDEIAAAISGINAMGKRVKGAPDRDTLLGLEGQGAVSYWKGFRALLKGQWGFDRRAYYPPPDPINALLSFGYTLLLNDIQGALRTVGLDPYLGVFHVIDYGRPSLALDLEEEWRAIIVDPMVLGLVNRGQIRPSDFELVSKNNGQKPGVYLQEKARQRFLQAYQQRTHQFALYPPIGKQETFRRMFLLQAQAFARVVLADGTIEYKPYTG